MWKGTGRSGRLLRLGGVQCERKRSFGRKGTTSGRGGGGGGNTFEIVQSHNHDHHSLFEQLRDLIRCDCYRISWDVGLPSNATAVAMETTLRREHDTLRGNHRASYRHSNDAQLAGDALFQWGDVAAVFSFGQNSYGELGHGDVDDRTAPTRVDLGPEIEVVDVACGNEQTTLLGADGHVYACGYNDSGQCGIAPMERVLRPMRVAALDDKKVARVFSFNGSEHVAALTESGMLYTFGFNSRGQLGLGTTSTSVTQPTLVSELTGKRVVDVACSYFHTLIVTAEGGLFACGRNDFGQLGTGDGIDRSVPTLVTALRDHPVRAVSCGQYHSVVAVTTGGLYAFGKNDHGQLGLGATSAPVLEPAKVTGELQNATVTNLACGYYHTLALRDSGSVYSFGRNEYGELGLGHKRRVVTPTALDALTRVRIVDVACGCYHSFALSDEGKVYPFGRNNHGQLGLETSVDCVTPQIIPSLRNQFVKKIAAGFYHSVCLTASSASALNVKLPPKSLSSDLRRMLNNPQRSDVTFVVEGVPLYAHSCILMARCEPLEKMLDGRTKDASLPEIEVPDCSREAFLSLLEFLYTDEVTALSNPNLDVDLLLELRNLSDQYLVDGLTALCDATLVRVLDVQNVCSVFQTAHFRDAFRLKRRCLAFMLDHFSEVIATPSFVAMPQPLLQEVLLAASSSAVTIPNQNRHVYGLREAD